MKRPPIIAPALLAAPARTMSFRRLLSIIAVAAVVGAMPAGAKPAELTSRYTKVGGCQLADSGDAEAGEDWVLNKCQGYGGIPVWLLFSDSARGYLGFGAKANVTGTFGLFRDDKKWPIEWRGRLEGRKFRPLTAIIRMGEPEGAHEGPSPKALSVFRLRPDGTSCIVGEAIGSNEEARKIADAAAGAFSCLQEPQLLK